MANANAQAALEHLNLAMELLDEGRTGGSLASVKAELAARRGISRVRKMVRVLDEIATTEDARRAERSAPGRFCRCKVDGDATDQTECPIHTVEHPYARGCCTEAEESHRHPTRTEYEAMYPVQFTEVSDGPGQRCELEVRRFPDGDGATITLLFPGEVDGGLCLDMSASTLRPVKEMIERYLASKEGAV